jgi:PKD repeat protein
VGSSGGDISSPDVRYLQYRVTLGTTDANASPDIGSVEIGYTTDAPIAVPGGPYVASEGVPIQLDGSGSADPNGSIVSYEWDLDYDGVTFDIEATGAITTATFPDGPQMRTIALRVRDNDGMTSEQTTTVEVSNVAPVAAVGAVGPVYEGQLVSFSGSGGDVPADTLTYEWDFDYDGVTFTSDVTGPTAATTYPDGPTASTLALRVTDDDGGESIDTTTISVQNVPPTVALTTGPLPVDEGQTLALDAAGSTDVPSDTLTYAWDLDFDGVSFGADATGVSTTITYANGPATPTVALVVSDGDGGVTTETLQIPVQNLAPTATAVASQTTLLEGQNVDLTGSGDDVDADRPTLTYAWDLTYNGVTFDPEVVGPTAVISYANGPATPTVAFRVADGDGDQAIVTLDLTVNNVAPTVEIADRSREEGKPMVFSAAVTDPGVLDTHTYLWDLGDGTTSTLAEPTHAYADDGAYTVRVTVYDDGADPASDQATVTVTNVAPSADAGIARTVDEGQVFTLSGAGTDVPADPLTYEWDFDYDGVTFDPDATGASVSTSYPDGPDAHTAALRVSDDEGGQTTDTVRITVVNVAPAIDAGGPYQAQAGETVTFTVAIVDAVGDSHTVVWDLDGDGSHETTGQTVTRTYQSNGAYQVSVSVMDDDGDWATDVAQVVIGRYRICLPFVILGATTARVAAGDGAP